MTLSISTEAKSEATVVYVDGDLDVYTAPSLRETLEQSLGSGVSLVLDLSGVHFIDSTALSVLGSSLQVSRSNGGDMRLVVGDPFVLKILRITGFDEMFAIYPNLEDALLAG